MSGGCAAIALRKRRIKHPIKALAGAVKGGKKTTSENKQHTHTHTLSRTTQTDTHLFTAYHSAMSESSFAQTCSVIWLNI